MSYTAVIPMKSAQASIELFVLVAFFLVFLMPLVFVMMSMSGEKVNEASLVQAQQLGRRLTDTADQVYIQGGDARKTEAFFFPSNIIGLQIGGAAVERKEIIIKISTYSGPTEMVFMTTAPLDTTTDWSYDGGNKYLGAGMKKLKIYNDPVEGVVMIDYAP